VFFVSFISVYFLCLEGKPACEMDESNPDWAPTLQERRW